MSGKIKMNFVRAVKVALKNFTRVEPGYFFLLRRWNKSATPSELVKKENIFIITSCINVADRTTSFIHNVDHTAKQRLEEVMIGLATVRRHYPDGCIVLIESSKLDPEMKEQLANAADFFFDYSEDSRIDRARTHFNKGVPQFVAYIKFMEENCKNFNAGCFHFLGARYVLTGAEAQSKMDSGSYFLYFPKANNVSTRYFFTRNIQIADMIRAFRITLFFAILGSSVEDVIFQYMPAVHFLSKIGVSGNVNGKHFIEE